MASVLVTITTASFLVMLELVIVYLSLCVRLVTTEDLLESNCHVMVGSGTPDTMQVKVVFCFSSLSMFCPVILTCGEAEGDKCRLNRSEIY